MGGVDISLSPLAVTQGEGSIGRVQTVGLCKTHGKRGVADGGGDRACEQKMHICIYI